MPQVEILATAELGDRSYVVHDGSEAIVVDMQRDIDRVEKLLAERGLEPRLVLETHVHNDYVTGGLELARRAGATYALNAADRVSFDRHPLQEGDELTVGRMTVRVLATPGHTDTHLSYVVSNTGGGPGAVFTGGSLLFGGVGRTDLLDPRRTEELTRAQYQSARRLAGELDDDTGVFPTHGFGSFCTSGSSAEGEDSTIGQEKARNDALVADDEDSFVTRLLDGLTAYPAYYAHMAPINRSGPTAPDLSPPTPVDRAELGRRLADGEWVVDLRDRTAYARAHLPGTVAVAVSESFSTYVGWLLPWGEPLTLVGQTAEQVADAQRQLARIGFDHLAGAATGEPASLLAPGGALRSYPRATFADLAGRRDDDVVLDVRRDDERAVDHLPGSAHVPIHELLHRLADVPSGRVWVHCASGMRAAIAASILDRAGRDVVLVDDDFEAARRTGHARHPTVR